MTAAHLVFFRQYLDHYPEQAEMAKSMPSPDVRRLMMALTGPLIGVLSGVAIRLLAWVASRFMKRRHAARMIGYEP